MARSPYRPMPQANNWNSFRKEELCFFLRVPLSLGQNSISYFSAYSFVTQSIAAILVFMPVQRYEFFSKSQLNGFESTRQWRCLCLCKGTNFLANHNALPPDTICKTGVYACAKVRIF